MQGASKETYKKEIIRLIEQCENEKVLSLIYEIVLRLY